MSDPYAIAGTDCLKNKLGIIDPAKLAAIEARIVAVRDVEIARDPLPGTYNLEHLKSFHYALFRDIYEWAGQTRTVNIAKPGSLFAAWQFVEDQVSAVLAELAKAGHLIAYNSTQFLEALAYFYGELNACHPFREGNGRTVRAFLRQLGAAAGYILDWSELSEGANIEACRINLNTSDTSVLKEVLRPVVRRI